jgi:hypothetical protein
MELATNNGGGESYKKICAVCELTDIIPIFPVRYALGQFDLTLKTLTYPSLTELYQSQGDACSGLVTRFLRSGWVFIYTEEGADSSTAANHPDASGSHDGDWHVYFYHSPDDGGDLGGLFVKYQWTGGTADKGEWLAYTDANNSPIKRSYVFVDSSISKISIAYSQHIWSLERFSQLKSSKADRAKFMQLMTVFPTQVEENVAPLQLLNNSRPSKAQLKASSKDQLVFTPELLVKELTQATFTVQHNKQEFEEGDNQEYLLSGPALYSCTPDTIDTLRLAMINKAEVGVIAALHDPVGIAGELGRFHTSMTLESLGDITENTYAYTTYQAIESVLGGVLPDSKQPFAISRQKNKIIVNAFNKKVSKKYRERISKYRPIDKWDAQQHYKRSAEAAQNDALAEMSKEQREQLLKAEQQVISAEQHAKPLEKAAEQLSDEFHHTRNALEKAAIVRDEKINNILALVKKWLYGTGAGSIATHFELLKEETQTKIAEDQLAGVHNLIGSIATIVDHLQSSRPGRIMLSEIMFGANDDSGWWVTHIVALSKSCDTIQKSLTRYTKNLINRHTGATQALQRLDGALDAFFGSISGTNSLCDGLIGSYKSNALSDPLEALPTLRFLFSLDTVVFDLSEQTIEQILDSISENTNTVKGWNSSKRARLLGKLTKQSIALPTVNADPISFDKPLNISAGLNRVIGGFELFLFSMNTYMTMGGMEKITQDQTLAGSTATWLRGNMAYNAALLADNFSKIIKKDIDSLIAKNAALIANKLNLNSAVISGQFTAKVQSVVGTGKLYNGLTKLAKVGPVLGIIDMISNAALSFSLADRGDYDAAAYAATGAVGGAAMLAFTILSGPVGWVMLGMGVLLTAISVIGLANSSDDDLEKWVKDSFWGGKTSKILGVNVTTEYYYWNEIERNKIEYASSGGKKVLKGFPAQVAISQTNREDYGEIKWPKVDKKQIDVFFKNEMSALNNYRYMPKITKTDDSILIYLPGFVVSKTSINLTYTLSIRYGNPRRGYTKLETIDISYPEKEGNEYWTPLKQNGLFKVTLPLQDKTSVFNKGELEFSYYPPKLGEKADEETLVIPYYYKGNQLITTRKYEL